jgi:hypothetical protein
MRRLRTVNRRGRQAELRRAHEHSKHNVMEEKQSDAVPVQQR